MARLSLTALDEWDYSPVVRYSPQPNPRVLAGGDTLTLTQTGSTYDDGVAPVFNVDGRLPSAAEIANAPWYILHVRCANDNAAPASLTDAVTISFDGTTLVLPVYNELDSTLAVTGSPAVQGSVYYRIPSTVTSVTFEAPAGISDPATLVYGYSVPQIPLAATGERASLTPIEEWNQCPWNIIGGGTLNLVDGVPQALVLPTAAQIAALNTPSYYMLAASAQFVTPAVGVESLQVTYNNSAVTQDVYPVDFNTGGAIITPFPNTAIANDPDNGLLRSYYNRLSTAQTTAVSLTAFGSNATVLYRWHIPTFPEAS